MKSINFNYQKATPCSAKGFTLLELLVAVLIIGIIAAIAFPKYSASVEKTRTAEAITKLNAFQKAVNEYILVAGSPPAAFSDLVVEVKGTKISNVVFYDNYFVYKLFPNEVSATRITPNRNNLNTSPATNGSFGFTSVYASGNSYLPTKFGMYCAVKKTTATSQQKQICASLGKLSFSSTANWDYYLM